MAGKVFEIAFNIMGRLGSSFGQAFSNANEQMKKLNKETASLKAEMKALDLQQKKGQITTQQYAQAYERVAAALAKAEQRQKSYAKSQSLQQKFDQSRGALRGAMVGTVETGMALGGPVMAAVNFETAMAGVAKQVDGARNDAGELTEIGQQAQKDILALSKTLMKSPTDIANAYALGARAGVKGAENLAKITEMSIMMGTAFEMPAEQITTQMAKIGNGLGYNLETAEGIAKLEALADTINYVDDKTLATGPDLIDFMNRTAGTIKALAPTMSEGMTVGLGGGLLAAGEKAEVAGTAINAMLTKFAAAPKQAKSFQNALATLGMSSEELQANIIDNADGAILDLFERIKQLDQATRNNVMAELIGQEHIDTVSKLTGNYDKFLDAIKLANDEAARGSVRKEFEIMYKTTASQLKGTQAAAERLAIALGSFLLPEIKVLSNELSYLATWFSDATQRHESLASKVVKLTAGILGGTVALSAFLWAVSAVIAPFVSFYTWAVKVQLASKASAVATWLWTMAQRAWNITMIVGKGLLLAGWYTVMAARYIAMAALTGAWTAAQWLWNAAMMANPIGLVIAGIGLLVGAGYLLVENWDTVQSWFITLWDNPKLALQQFIDGIYSKFGKAFKFLEEQWAWIKNIFSQPVSANVQASVSADGAPNVYENATGGIYGKGAFLTTFAESSAEAAIPLDGSPRAVSLWSQAGEMLGVSPSGGGISVTFAPVINAAGGNAQEIRQMLQAAEDDLIDKLQALKHQQRRTSYA